MFEFRQITKEDRTCSLLKRRTFHPVAKTYAQSYQIDLLELAFRILICVATGFLSRHVRSRWMIFLFNQDEVQIEIAFTATDDVRALVAELENVLSAEYPPEQRHGLSVDAIFQPHVRFFLATLRGAAVGCGGVALFPDYAEVKRMYVLDSVRGQGVADAILARIEEEVRSAGLSLLRLETGVRQVAAMRFYARGGFRECPAFGAYAAMSPHSIATSVFLEKRIGT